MAPVLGDFLRPAGEHIAAAARYGGELPVPVKRGVIIELDRLVARLARYLDDLALPAGFTPASTADPAVRAALDVRLALPPASCSGPAARAAVRGGTEPERDRATPASSVRAVQDLPPILNRPAEGLAHLGP